jgi:monoamine oxidase
MLGPVTTTPPDPRAALKHGLPARGASKHIVVAGAGIAGLVAAHELTRAGHRVTVLEARDTVGGRVRTLREPFAPGVHAELGAMRIPRSHELTVEYCHRFGLRLVPFVASNPRAYVMVAGERFRLREVRSNPGLIAPALTARERAAGVDTLWSELVAEVRAQIAGYPRDEAWDKLVAEFGSFSLRDLLRARGWSTSAIELFDLIGAQEPTMDVSCVEALHEAVENCFVSLVSIDGGMDRLPMAIARGLGHRIQCNAEIVAIDQHHGGVAITYREHGARQTVRGDAAIIALPFSTLRLVETSGALSAAKLHAIRNLPYETAIKTFAQTRRRFWEKDDRIFGGATTTDLPVRGIYYPNHGRDTGKGALLVSYTWGEAAKPWARLDPRARLDAAIADASKIHPQLTTEFEFGISHAWHEEPFARGAFSYFSPGQLSSSLACIVAPEGRIAFAGEHASRWHGWIEGAVESGLRAAAEVHAAY